MISNRRDLLLQALGEVLYVERRLVGGVLRSLVDAVQDEQLKDALRQHLEQTRAHVDRCETAFRRLEAAPSANIVQAFESAVKEHEEQAGQISSPALADVLHATAALRTEHLEQALYHAVLALGGDEVGELRESLADEHEAQELLERELRRLADAR